MKLDARRRTRDGMDEGEGDCHRDHQKLVGKGIQSRTKKRALAFEIARNKTIKLRQRHKTPKQIELQISLQSNDD